MTVNQTQNNSILLRKLQVETPLGAMTAIADHERLYFLQFTDDEVQDKVRLFIEKTGSSIIDGTTAPLTSIENELNRYFEGTLKKFNTAIGLLGTPFQKATWTALSTIPYGVTCSYADIASSIGKSSAFRAVGQTNSRNPLAIIIPCHRVIQADRSLGGYNGGLYRKQWLLNHEKNRGTNDY